MKVDQQLRRNDCGISAVKTVCNILDVDVPRSYIEEHLQIDQEGISLESIHRFFEDHGFESKFHILDINDFENEVSFIKSQFPCLTPIKSRRGLHYVVLNNYKKRAFEVFDPAKGKTYKMSLDEFRKTAYYASSNLGAEGTLDLLFFKIREELKEYSINIPKRLSKKEQIDWFNKLCYFNYHKENYGFRSEEDAQRFLNDVLFFQEINSIPQNFQNFVLDTRKQVVLKSPIVLSVQNGELLGLIEGSEEQSIYWRLYSSIKGIRPLWFMFISTTLIAGLITYLAVFINQILIDHILPSYQLGILFLFAIGVGIFYIFDLAFSTFKRYISIHLGNALDRYFLTVFDKKLNQYSIQFLHSFRRGDLTERLKDSTKIKSFFITFFSKIFINVFIALFSIMILLAINWQLSIFVFGVLLIFGIMFWGLTPIIKRLEQQRFAVKADFYSRFIEKIDGIQVIKTLQLENYSSSEINNKIDELIKVRTKSKYISLFNSAVSSIIVSFATLFIILFTSRQMIIDNSITLGMIITFVALSGKIFKAFRSLLDYNLTIQEHTVILKRFFDFEEKGNKASIHNSHEKINNLHISKYSLKNVQFSYAGNKPVLKDLNFEIGKNERIWIKGKNGSGKSTLCKVLGLLYPPTEGDVLINGIDHSLYNEELLRSKIALVSNEDILFNDKLLFNITFGRKVDIRKLVYYTKALDFYDFIQDHPDKFDMMIHENARNLSTGQRKKVLLLRALMSNAELIILDEIFNGIDVESKLLAEQLINELPDKSFLIISHLPVDEINFTKKYILKNGRLYYKSA